MKNDGILPQPIQGPGFYRKCPKCEKKDGLDRAGVKGDRVIGKLKKYKCRFCGETVCFGGKLPDDAI